MQSLNQNIAGDVALVLKHQTIIIQNTDPISTIL